MPTTITVGVTAITPYYVFLCDDPPINCVYIGSGNTSSYIFDVPPILDGLSTYNVKVIDNDGCEKIETVII